MSNSKPEEITLDLTDLKLLHQEGEVVKGDLRIVASDGCSERLQDADEAGVRL